MASRRVSSPWFILGLLMLVSVISFIDRQIISVLVDDIRSDLDVTDFQIGLLTGPAFVLLYIVGNLSSGWLADRYDRVRLIAAALCIWSLATAASGFAAGFAALFVARAVVGLGEGSIGPAFMSLISDSFERRRLPLALSVYSMAGAIGPGLAVLFGGLVAASANDMASGLHLPGDFRPWQLTFIMIGLPGLLVAPLLMFSIKAPPRHQPSPDAAAAAPDSLREFWRNRRALIMLFVSAIGLICASELALLMWLPTLLIRVHGQSAADVASTFGTTLILFGAGGALLWGFIAARSARRYDDMASLRTMTIAMGIMAPFLAIAPLLGSAHLILLAVVPVLLCKRAYVGLGHATVQLICPSSLRGRVAAIYLASTSAIGALLGPPAIGAISSFLLKDDQSIGIALAAVSGSTCIAGVLLLLLCRGPYKRALAMVGTAS